MANQNFFTQKFKDEVKRAVAEVETRTSAEIVVAVRPFSTTYRHIDFAVGSVIALAVLCVFLYHPEPFEFTYLPLELAGAWAIGTLVTLSFSPLRRALASNESMRRAVDAAASAAFTDCGVFKTRGRSGILVLVSTFERRAGVRADVGVPVVELGDAWKSWVEKVESAAKKQSGDDFLAAIRALGPLLSEKLPRAADDANELADDVSEAA